MSHDTDKLIRQLSLVAFLMAERRPLTARDIKSNVEGYQEMSDEAFARRFYSDRAELVGLGVPLDSQRDEFTGEELYTLRSERYFLPALDLDDDELAALQTCLYLLEGRFAYAEPLRLALQNLALGRASGALDDAPTENAVRVEVRDPDYSPELQGRLGRLEGAISKQRTVKFRYWSIARDEERERTLNPYALLPENGTWYVIGEDQDDGVRKSFRVSRIRSDIRYASRRERDFRVPADFDVEEFRGRAEWQFGEIQGDARIEVAPDTGWWVQRVYAGPRNRVDGEVFVTEYASLPLLARWILRQDGRAVPLEPPALRRLVLAGARAARTAHEGAPPTPAAPARRTRHEPLAERSAGPVAPERFGVLQSLLAYLLAACGEDREGVIKASEIVERFSIPADQLEEHLSLLNLVNFGGGCYAVYAELQGDEVHVDKELFGDTFRRPPRLTPLEARAIRLALEFVGPMVSAGSHSPLERVRAKLEETFGAFDLAQTPEPHAGAEEDLVGTLTRAIGSQRLVELEYLKPDSSEVETRTVEPYSIERRLPHWYVHTWDVDRDQPRSYRLDRMRNAKQLRKGFTPRTGFDPHELGHATSARVWYSPEVARWEVEKGATPLADKSAVAERAVGSAEWLVGEVLSFRGEAVVLEPPELRKRVAERARELTRLLQGATPQAASR
ncbi:MAG: WYL domain-containing protein [Actinobacteria bacterium]|nr:WYL domain-containing protein [Actinomycetota bacterium]MBV8396348.1 WYL domain-containing protein [Actinomycetota bacterium]MBV8598077.1 WYL domain-containing protein [Actinomycetota bacterium]